MHVLPPFLIPPALCASDLEEHNQGLSCKEAIQSVKRKEGIIQIMKLYNLISVTNLYFKMYMYNFLTGFFFFLAFHNACNITKQTYVNITTMHTIQ